MHRALHRSVHVAFLNAQRVQCEPTGADLAIDVSARGRYAVVLTLCQQFHAP